MNQLSTTLEEVRTKIGRYKTKGLSEEDTKTALINPVLCALGWQVGNLDEVSMEFRLKSSNNPVDYALRLAGNPTVLVEAKALGQTLSGKMADQIMGYTGTSGVTWVVLTNGDEYRIYNAIVAVPFEQKLFRSVRLSDPDSRAEETLALLSKDKINDIGAQWQIHFADSQVRDAVVKLFSPTPDPLLSRFVKQNVKGLNRKEILASLGRVLPKFAFQVEPAGTAAPPVGGDGQYSEFWEPIRRGPGLFKGKSVPLDGDGWISKTVRGIVLALVFRNRACYVALQFQGKDREERRNKAISLFPPAKYSYKTSESDKWAFVRFPVIDKGRNDREQWPEIREKLTKLGEEIYSKIAGSDV